MTPDEAADLAARTLTAIDAQQGYRPDWHPMQAMHAADRERVASDLAGLRAHQRRSYGAMYCRCGSAHAAPCPDARRYADGLRRTARLYGIEA